MNAYLDLQHVDSSCVASPSKVGSFPNTRTVPVLIATPVLPIENCGTLLVATHTFYSFGLPVSTHLFFLRVYAIFSHSKPTIWFFVVLRYLISAGVIIQAFFATAAHIGPTKGCILVEPKSYCAAGTLAVALNDTVVVLAISLRLLRNSTANTWHARWTAFFGGKGMGQISRALMRTGQQYYM